VGWVAIRVVVDEVIEEGILLSGRRRMRRRV